ncbi:MAG: ABC transporter ATP-binding protein [Lachnospiraceae bacterium]|nr:ABC transporter ATP-binding protein [Lachnospiraceae bacterium]
MITIKNTTFQYKGSDKGGVKNLSLSVQKGETILLCGSSGAGKTTILRLINGLIPHFYKGDLTGSVMVDNVDIQHTELYHLADKIGTVFQNPRSQFFSVDTDGEVVFGPENIGIDPMEIRRRKEVITEEMSLTPLLSRSLFELSGGEKQKIACASVAALFPDVILLDEPSSNLDFKGISELRRIISLWKKQGKTIIISEHRLWYVKGLVDRVLYIKDGKIDKTWDGDEFYQLGESTFQKLKLRPGTMEQSFLTLPPKETHSTADSSRLDLTNYYFTYEKRQRIFGKKLSENDKNLALNIPNLTLPGGFVIGLIGSNGAGKSTFLRCLCGLEKRCHGEMALDEKNISGKKAISLCYLVMQDVNHQLFTDSVASEVLLSMKEKSEEKAMDILASLELDAYKDVHPMALSGGQKQRVAIASAMAAKAQLLLFDEPTSGLDYAHMISVANLLQQLTQSGKTVLVSTHDPELLTLSADYIVHLEHGRVVEHYPLSNNTLPRLKEFFQKQI